MLGIGMCRGVIVPAQPRAIILAELDQSKVNSNRTRALYAQLLRCTVRQVDDTSTHARLRLLMRATIVRSVQPPARR